MVVETSDPKQKKTSDGGQGAFENLCLPTSKNFQGQGQPALGLCILPLTLKIALRFLKYLHTILKCSLPEENKAMLPQARQSGAEAITTSRIGGIAAHNLLPTGIPAGASENQTAPNNN